MRYFMLFCFIALVSMSCLQAFYGAWQQAIWILFMLTVTQNMATQGKQWPK